MYACMYACMHVCMYVYSEIRKKKRFDLWSSGLKPIKNKQHHSFIRFDIKEFYPSISQDLPNDNLVLDQDKNFNLIG